MKITIVIFAMIPTANSAAYPDSNPLIAGPGSGERQIALLISPAKRAHHALCR